MTPVILSPALPSEFLAYVTAECTYPTTLIICSTRADFISALQEDILRQTVQNERQEPLPQPLSELHNDSGSSLRIPPQDALRSRLLAMPLSQLAVAKHIRLVFVPTVSHLRVFLSLFPITDTNVSAPPPPPTGQAALQPRRPLLLVFGLVDLHRDTSEWSAQGLSNTAAALVDAAQEAKFRAVVVENKRHEDDGTGLEGILEDAVPVLSSSVRRAAPDLEEAGWTGRTIELHRVLGRWFKFWNQNWQRASIGVEL